MPKFIRLTYLVDSELEIAVNMDHVSHIQIGSYYSCIYIAGSEQFIFVKESLEKINEMINDAK